MMFHSNMKQLLYFVTNLVPVFSNPMIVCFFPKYIILQSEGQTSNSSNNKQNTFLSGGGLLHHY